MLQFVRNSCGSFVKLRPTWLLDCCNPFVKTRIRRVDRTCEDREMNSVKKKKRKKERKKVERRIGHGIYGTSLNEAPRGTLKGLE